MKAFTFTVLFAISISSALAQDCKVEPENLKGTYTGECINGKAEGKGIATGLNRYEGFFRKGYPDGEGKYVWEDQSWYFGNFRKGNREGLGEMHYSINGRDSTVNGYWKKDKYVGKYEKAYAVMGNTTRINRIDVRSQQKDGNTIIINTKAISQNYPVYITDITVLSGNYLNKSNMNVSNGAMLILKQVTFPFRARFNIANGENVDILFNEPGDWDVNIDLM